MKKRRATNEAIEIELTNAFADLQGKAKDLRVAFGSALRKHLPGKQLNTEVPLQKGEVVYTIGGVGIFPGKIDAANRALLFDVELYVENMVLDHAILITIKPVYHQNKVFFQATVKKGADPHVPDFHENYFLEANMFDLPERVTDYLSRSSFLFREEKAALGPLEVQWKALLGQKEALKALLIEACNKYLQGKRLSKEIAYGPKVRHIITGTFVNAIKEDEEHERLQFYLGFIVEDLRLENAVIVTMQPILGEGEKVAYKTTIKKGPNSNMPGFPAIDVVNNYATLVPERVALHLAHSPLVLKEAA